MRGGGSGGTGAVCPARVRRLSLTQFMKLTLLECWSAGVLECWTSPRTPGDADGGSVCCCWLVMLKVTTARNAAGSA